MYYDVFINIIYVCVCVHTPTYTLIEMKASV